MTDLHEGSPSPEPVRSLYVHAPFCPRRCVYCDFAVEVAREPDAAGWLDAIRGELALVEEEGLFTLAPMLDTVFVGGGTPSHLGPAAMAGLAGLLGSHRLSGSSLEWTAEANPESFSRSVAEAWHLAGVNRISLGAQTFSDPALRWMGRLHREEDTIRAVGRARKAGIRNLGLDLIFGLPDEVERDFERDLELALGLDVPHLSLYGLTVEEATPLRKAVDRGDVSRPSETRYRDEYLEASSRLAREGFHHYEVSNFARPGFEARHNLVYWNHQPYLGLGNSAHSFRHPIRRWNLRGWAEYQKATTSGRMPRAGDEELTDQDLRMEKIWLDLRTDRGVRDGALSAGARSLLEGWVREGWAERRNTAVGLTPEGWLILDSLTVELDAALASG